MTKQLLHPDWVSCLNGFDKLVVGFSGGLDSTVLLHALTSHSSIQNKLVAVYVNHAISPNAWTWQEHCQNVCANLNVSFVTRDVQFDRGANIEERARTARYTVFKALLGERDCLLVGHHLDDQAETVLLQLFRGAGLDGLSAMPELGIMGLGSIARPLLLFSREQLYSYASCHQLKWIEDESNLDTHYSRNYLRHQIMPLLTQRWPTVTGSIARAASHCQQAVANLNDLAEQDSKELSGPVQALSIDSLKELSNARISNVLRVWLKKNQIRLPSTSTFQRLINEVLFASPDATPIVSWDDVQVRRYQNYLYIDPKGFCVPSVTTSPRLCEGVTTPAGEPVVSCDKVSALKQPTNIVWAQFPSPIILEGTQICLSATQAEQGLMITANERVVIRFRQGGETIVLRGQTKSLKKLFQEWQIAPWLRDSIPLIYINDKLAAVVGYAVSDLFFSTTNGWCIS